MLLIDILRLLLNTAASLLTFCLLLRALMQWVRIHPSNPLSPFIFSMTDWLVKPLRKGVPGYGGIDWASIFGAFVVSFVLHIVLVLVTVGLASGGPSAICRTVHSVEGRILCTRVRLRARARTRAR